MKLTDPITKQKITGDWIYIPWDTYELLDCPICDAKNMEECYGELPDGTPIELSSFIHKGREFF